MYMYMYTYMYMYPDAYYPAMCLLPGTWYQVADEFLTYLLT